MIRTVAFIGLLAAAAAGSSRADNQAKEKAPAAPKAAPAPKGGAPKGGAPKMGPGLRSPASPALKLYQLSPAERERALEKLPPLQQQAIRNNLKWFDSLPKDQQQMVLKRGEMFAALPPAEQRAIRQQLQNLAHLPQERRQLVQRALQVLQALPEEERVERLNRPAFRARFTPEELQIIGKLSEVMAPPM